MPLFRDTILVLSFIWLFLSEFSIAQTTPTTIVSAQPATTQSLKPPTCAKQCIEGATETQNCAGTDNECLCQHTSAIQTAISSCLSLSGSCSEADKSAALNFYPQSCALLGYSTFTSTTVGIVSATGVVPSRISQNSISSLVLAPTLEATAKTTLTPEASGGYHGLGLPAILGITLGGVVLITAICVVLIWLYLRRRQQLGRKVPARRTIDLESEFGMAVARPPRAGSTCSTFIVEEDNAEKEVYTEGPGLDYPLSRSSTLVSVPSRAVLRDKALPEIRESTAERESIIGTHRINSNGTGIWNSIRSSAQSLRASWVSGRERSNQNSLMVEPLAIRKSGLYDEFTDGKSF